jgi:hypothetical protein
VSLEELESEVRLAELFLDVDPWFDQLVKRKES